MAAEAEPEYCLTNKMAAEAEPEYYITNKMAAEAEPEYYLVRNERYDKASNDMELLLLPLIYS